MNINTNGNQKTHIVCEMHTKNCHCAPGGGKAANNVGCIRQRHRIDLRGQGPALGPERGVAASGAEGDRDQ